ncbi:protein of unknown function [Hyphomicrobium sp. MC1]|nr:protein of unknown function [Hyphomicrobium sp. MC1]
MGTGNQATSSYLMANGETFRSSAFPIRRSRAPTHVPESSDLRAKAPPLDGTKAECTRI